MISAIKRNTLSGNFEMTIIFDSAQNTLLREIQRHLAIMCTDGARKSILSLFTHKETRSGIYIYGDVGRGKTTLMQYVFDQLHVTKQRYHFDTFFGQLHQKLLTSTIDSIANDIHHHYRVIWIDELQIYDIATAMLLRRLIPTLIEHHVIILMTGNVAPDDFYKDGLNHDQFADFIPNFIQHFHCFALDGMVDYRLQSKSRHINDSYTKSISFWLASPAATVEMNDVFQSYAIGTPASPFVLNLNHRSWILDKTLPSAVFIDFASLALEDRAFDDYRALIQTFPVIFLSNVPIFDSTNRDACRRFMAFIDILYDEKAKLYISAETYPTDLYQDKSAKLPFARTASRLTEIL